MKQNKYYYKDPKPKYISFSLSFLIYNDPEMRFTSDRFKSSTHLNSYLNCNLYPKKSKSKKIVDIYE